MPTDIIMPRLSDSMEEGTILSWLKQAGEDVAVGEELVEIETDKANMTYEADVAGSLIEVLAAAGQTCPVGAVIARVGGGEPEAGAEPADAQAVERANGARLKVSPLARRLASERGIDLSLLIGSGPGGRVVKADVEGAQATPGVAEAAPSPPLGAAVETAKGTVRTVEPTKLQAVVARRMGESKATAPHFYLQAEIDMGAAVAARRHLKELAGEGDVVPSPNDMVVKACALALREFPLANGAYRDGRFELYSRINVGIAVAAPDALVVPTIFDADSKGLREIATEARSLAARVRDGSITPPELAGGTFSVSSLGMFGVASFQAVINSPQAAILAVGEIAERPVVRDGEVVPAPTMPVTLSCDHRILYGAEGARFLARVKVLLEEPLGLAL
jgi:pyruvate dehydrogenase E2 component (dihydrolipoamide acetyltransferase)